MPLKNKVGDINWSGSISFFETSMIIGTHRCYVYTCTLLVIIFLMVCLPDNGTEWHKSVQGVYHAYL